MSIALKRRRIDTVLRHAGLGGLDDPGVVMQLGFLVRDHDHLLQIINVCEPGMRSAMYDALRPHLRFDPKPLDVYVSELGSMAEAEKLPTIGEDGRLYPYRALELETANRAASETMAKHTLVLSCRKCTCEAAFSGPDRYEAVKAARDAGWTYGVDREGKGREICPGCPASRGAI